MSADRHVLDMESGSSRRSCFGGVQNREAGLGANEDRPGSAVQGTPVCCSIKYLLHE